MTASTIRCPPFIRYYGLPVLREMGELRECIGCASEWPEEAFCVNGECGHSVKTCGRVRM